MKNRFLPATPLSLNTAVLDTATVQVGPCGSTETECPGYNDGTGYKVWFNGPAKAEGETTIQLTATGNNTGATTYTSFFFRWPRRAAIRLRSRACHAIRQWLTAFQAAGRCAFNDVVVDRALPRTSISPELQAHHAFYDRARGYS